MPSTLSQLARDITRVQFVGKDFDTYVTEINGLLLEAFGDTFYNNFVVTDQGQILIESVADGLSTLSWFADRQASECYLSDTVIPSNAAKLARLVGYKPRGAVPSSGEVSITLTTAQPFVVDVPAGTQLSGPGELLYETNEKITFNSGELGPKTVGITEGSTTEETYVATGLANQVFALRRVPDSQFVSEGSVQVFVDNVEWSVPDFITFDKSNQAEALITQDPPIVRTGDGIAGNIPPEGSEVRITYRTVFGSAGQAQAGTISSFRLPVVSNFTPIPATVSNGAATSVGSDPETLSETKANAPRVFRTADRAVTAEDYTTLSESYVDADFGAIAVARAVIARGVEEDAETRTILQDIEAQCGALTPDLVARLDAHWSSVLSSSCKANLVSVQVLQRDGDGRLIAPNLGLANSLKVFLEDRKEVTQTVSVTDGSINLFTVDTTANVNIIQGFNRSIVAAFVKDVIDSFLVGKKFGESVFLSQLVDRIQAVSGVDYVNVIFTSPASKVDTNGNVIVEDYEVVTLGTTTVNPLN